MKEIIFLSIVAVAFVVIVVRKLRRRNKCKKHPPFQDYSETPTERIWHCHFCGETKVEKKDISKQSWP